MTPHAFLVVGYLALAVASISYTLTKGVIFRPLRLWVTDRSEWLGELIMCPYCTSHWVAFAAVLVYRPRAVSSGFLPLDLFVSAMVIVALATPIFSLIYISIDQLKKATAPTS